MANVVLLFGMVSIIAIDSDSWVDSVFKDMFTAVGIIYFPLANGDHKRTRVEKYHHFLNKSQTIFLQNVKNSEYAWNSTPIDGTNILRSVADVGL